MYPESEPLNLSPACSWSSTVCTVRQLRKVRASIRGHVNVQLLFVTRAFCGTMEETGVKRKLSRCFYRVSSLKQEERLWDSSLSYLFQCVCVCEYLIKYGGSVVRTKLERHLGFQGFMSSFMHSTFLQA